MLHYHSHRLMPFLVLPLSSELVFTFTPPSTPRCSRSFLHFSRLCYLHAAADISSLFIIITSLHSFIIFFPYSKYYQPPLALLLLLSFQLRHLNTMFRHFAITLVIIEMPLRATLHYDSFRHYFVGVGQTLASIHYFHYVSPYAMPLSPFHFLAVTTYIFSRVHYTYYMLIRHSFATYD